MERTLFSHLVCSFFVLSIQKMFKMKAICCHH